MSFVYSHRDIMMTITKTTDKATYTAALEQFPVASFLQSWEWGEFAASRGQKAHQYIVKDGGRIIVVFQALEMTVPLLKFQYLYIAYGPIGNPEANIFTTIIDALRKEFPKAICFRFEPTHDWPLDNISTKPTARIQPGKTLLLDLQKNEEALLKEMHHKTRYNIKVAEKHGVTIAKDTDADTALALITETAKRQGYRDHGTSYYQKLFTTFNAPQGQLRTHIYTAKLENTLLAIALYLDFAGTRTFLFGGSSDAYKNVMAPYLLHWTAIRDAEAAGLTNYDFWGIETSKGSTPGFVRFKLGFGGKELSYPKSFDVINLPLQYNLYKLLRHAQKFVR